MHSSVIINRELINLFIIELFIIIFPQCSKYYSNSFHVKIECFSQVASLTAISSLPIKYNLGSNDVWSYGHPSCGRHLHISHGIRGRRTRSKHIHERHGLASVPPRHHIQRRRSKDASYCVHQSLEHRQKHDCCVRAACVLLVQHVFDAVSIVLEAFNLVQEGPIIEAPVIIIIFPPTCANMRDPIYINHTTLPSSSASVKLSFPTGPQSWQSVPRTQ